MAPIHRTDESPERHNGGRPRGAPSRSEESECGQAEERVDCVHHSVDKDEDGDDLVRRVRAERLMREGKVVK